MANNSVDYSSVSCPHCGADPTDESVETARSNEQLRALGYTHTDQTLACPNGHEWTHGVPRGTPETDVWGCDACGDRYTPRDVFHSTDGRLHVVVKCRTCYYKPDEPLHFDIPTDVSERWGILLGHPDVCGSIEDADTEQRAQFTLL
jgi:hypothetical protein